MKYLALLACMGCGAAAFGQSFSSTGGPYAIPDSDPNGVKATVDVTGSVGALKSVSFTNLHHSWVGDLTMTLTDPNNNSVSIMNRAGVGPNSTFGLSFDLSGANSYSFVPGTADLWANTSNPLPSGAYSPFDNNNGTEVMTNYSGVGGSGTWSLFVTDSAGGDTGGFDVVTLTFTPVPEPASLAILGLGALALLRRRKKA